MLMIKKKGMENSFGQMEDNIKGIGKMANSMAEDYIKEILDCKRRVNGLRENYINGLFDYTLLSYNYNKTVNSFSKI
mgnify:CR=1 FL=1